MGTKEGPTPKAPQNAPRQKAGIPAPMLEMFCTDFAISPAMYGQQEIARTVWSAGQFACVINLASDSLNEIGRLISDLAPVKVVQKPPLIIPGSMGKAG